jgi:hypothetical protein
VCVRAVCVCMCFYAKELKESLRNYSLETRSSETIPYTPPPLNPFVANYCGCRSIWWAGFDSLQGQRVFPSSVCPERLRDPVNHLSNEHRRSAEMFWWPIVASSERIWRKVMILKHASNVFQVPACSCYLSALLVLGLYSLDGGWMDMEHWWNNTGIQSTRVLISP